ncbi:DinB family protein [Fibrella aquatica]|uniref:DinB family protein n=1 Tax=Fibrella aquatica TaxID=3242487 RepID=UPI003520A8C2
MSALQFPPASNPFIAMSLTAASADILAKLTNVISQLTNEQYARALPVLSGNTIGRHVRHILEFYELLVKSPQTGRLNYDQRQRDLPLERQADEALRRIGHLNVLIHQLNLDQPLLLEADLSVAGAGTLCLTSSIARELLYNMEHAIHHMALIQVAVQHAFSGIDLPPHFGIAYSTVQHEQGVHAH